jgi:hypothetical protein
LRAILKVVAACCLCIVASPKAAFAEWHFTPFIGLTFKGNTNIKDPEIATGDKHAALGGTVSVLGRGIFGGEGLIEFVPGFFQGKPGRTDSAGEPINSDVIESSRVTTIMGNIVLTAPRKYTEYFLRPFVSGGFGLLRIAKSGATEVFPLQDNFAGFNIGGGAVGFFSQNTGVRFDLRYYSTLHDTERIDATLTGDPVHLRYMTLSVGVVIRR